MKIVIILITISIIIGIGGLYSFKAGKSTIPAATESQPNQPATTPALAPSPANSNALYRDYTEQAFITNSTKRRVIFFHANWCPTCKTANQAFEENQSRIPQDVIIFKANYDSENQLKQKYAITYQHTFVQVDSQGNEIAKWNGGDIDTLRENLK